ncbi:MAG: 2-C-methyl-D-erythritol 4-phosphate cytidylyltransferase [Saezia sp.]
MTKFWPLVPCAGHGARSGAQIPKQYVEVAGKAVIAHTLAALQSVPVLEKVTVVLSPEDVLFAKYCPDFDGHMAPVGGETRAASVRAGLRALRELGAQDADWVLVHDAARCLLQPQWVEELIATCRDDEVGGLLAQPVPDTLKLAVDGRSSKTVSRQNMWLAQTPQMFRLKMLEQALVEAEKRGIEVTDEASSIEALGLKPKLVVSSSDNFKLTYPEDFERAGFILTSYF